MDVRYLASLTNLSCSVNPSASLSCTNLLVVSDHSINLLISLTHNDIRLIGEISLRIVDLHSSVRRTVVEIGQSGLILQINNRTELVHGWIRPMVDHRLPIPKDILGMRTFLRTEECSSMKDSARTRFKCFHRGALESSSWNKEELQRNRLAKTVGIRTTIQSEGSITILETS
uniref:Uncharacterized protein n=1 Tax=Vespula pensylvanica TaxID=30213 RepID=A0A834PCI9_VESPE|nr:hypothetical protein H0235_003235 [Vespula pensylvanica]